MISKFELFVSVGRLLPDSLYLKLLYRLKMGKKLDLKNPKSFNEKLQWLKIHDRKPEYIRMVDKHEVKEYVSEKIGKQYIIPSYGLWERFEDISFENLPNQFVLKCTHDSGGLVICKDKTKFDLVEAKRKIEHSLKTNYYYKGREWPYKKVTPRILAEEFMVDESGIELKDYKVLCFKGEPKLIELHQGRYLGKHYQDFYDTSWKKQSINQLGESAHPEEAQKPLCLDKMLELSAVLSKNIPHVRVDWYVINDKLYFGELTFFDASGFDAFVRYEDELLLGSWITLPKK